MSLLGPSSVLALCPVSFSARMLLNFADRSEGDGESSQDDTMGYTRGAPIGKKQVS